MTDDRIGGQIEMMYTGRRNSQVFSWNPNPELARAIAKNLFLSLGEAEVTQFS